MAISNQAHHLRCHMGSHSVTCQLIPRKGDIPTISPATKSCYSTL